MSNFNCIQNARFFKHIFCRYCPLVGQLQHQLVWWWMELQSNRCMSATIFGRFLSTLNCCTLLMQPTWCDWWQNREQSPMPTFARWKRLQRLLLLELAFCHRKLLVAGKNNFLTVFSIHFQSDHYVTNIIRFLRFVYTITNHISSSNYITEMHQTFRNDRTKRFTNFICVT